VSVSPNVVVMAHVVTRDIPKACVAMCDIPVQAVRDPTEPFAVATRSVSFTSIRDIDSTSQLRK
jgi:hypothetical protein